MKTAAAIAFLCAVCAFSLSVKRTLRHNRSPLEALQIGQPMPAFSLPDTKGNPVSFNSISASHKLVMINFWASWCGPCRVEMPAFERLYAAKNRDGFTILAINEDEESSAMNAYLSAKPVTFPILVDEGQALMERLGIRSLPTTILVGGDGKIMEVTEGVSEYLDFSITSHLKASQNGEPLP